MNTRCLKLPLSVIAAAAACLALLGPTLPAADAQDAGLPIKSRHSGVLREGAAQAPRTESDQTRVDGWPLYRTERGQQAFNDAMATLKATDGAAPAAPAFKGCSNLDCPHALPRIDREGWLPAGRIWVSPTDYVLIAHSPRLGASAAYRRRSVMNMTYFVFHEFHNSSRNTDLYDTVSSHRGHVFVPFYMGKPATDANGRRFVVVLQVAPYDVVSVHASNLGSAGPGIEVARNAGDAVEPLQNLAGILVASIAKEATPRLQIVNHRGREGEPMREAFERRQAWLRNRPAAAVVTLPFVPAPAQRVAAATAQLDSLVQRRGASPRIPVAERAIVTRYERTSAMPATLPPLALVEPPRLVPRPACPSAAMAESAALCRPRLRAPL